jgi:hypothetical protein
MLDGQTKRTHCRLRSLQGKIGHFENGKAAAPSRWREAIVRLFNVDKDFSLLKNEKAGRFTGSFTVAPSLGLEPRTP